MTNTEQLHQDFLRDFTELLQRYNAEFDMCDDTPEVFFHYISDENADIIREHSTLNLPNYINPN